MTTETALSIITVTHGDPAGFATTAASLRGLPGDLARGVEWVVVPGNAGDLSYVSPAIDAVAAIRMAKFIAPVDEGIYEAMNAGIASSTGQFLWFLNGGDWLHDGAVLAAMLNAANQHPRAGLIYSDAVEGAGPTAPLFRKPARPASSFYLGMPSHHQAMLFRRACLPAGGYDTRYRLAADYNLVLSVAAHHQAAYLPGAVSGMAPGGRSMQDPAKGRAEQCAIRQALFPSRPMANRVVSWAQWVSWSIRSALPGPWRWLRKALLRPPAAPSQPANMSEPPRAPGNSHSGLGRSEAPATRPESQA